MLDKKKLKWAPEILHLLLELSDKPVFKSKLEDLDLLKESELDAGPPLRWKDLIAEDPLLRDKSVWRNVDFGAESSEGEDVFEDSRSEFSGTDTTIHSSIDGDFNRRPEDYLVETVDKEGLEKLRQAQFWKKTPTVGGIKLETVKKPITELQAIREVLFMLSGLPTSLFEIHSVKPTVITPSKDYALKHASTSAFQKLATDFAERGSAVMILRSWAKRPQSIPLIGIFQSSTMERIEAFDTLLSAIHRRFVAIEEDVAVSILKVWDEINPHLRPLVRLSKIIERFEAEQYPHAFRYLEMLYDETCTLQMAGDDEMHTFMAKIFFDCFQVYLRPIRTWMEDGELMNGDKVFFVSEATGDVGPASIWHSRFKIRHTKSGILHAPRFLRTAANKIFTTGKSVVVLKHLNQFESLESSRGASEPILDFVTVCDPSRLKLAPFAELFDVAFDEWVQSKHQFASSRLRKTLFDSCGLHTALDALTHLYFMADGSTAANFANSIFDKLDTLDASWNDRFTLTELAQSTFGSIPSVSSDRLRTQILTLPQKFQDVVKCRRSVKTLSAVELRYHLSWPIQIILTPATIPSYQRLFSFLFQIRRSSNILSRQRLSDDVLTHSSSSDERALYYSLRTRLLWFTNTLYYYLTSLVIEPNSRKIREKLKDAEDVDTMIDIHSGFIKSTIDQALLGSKLELIHKTILKILDLAINLEDAQAANAAANKETVNQQQEMMDLSMASLGLRTVRKSSNKLSRSLSKAKDESSSDEDDEKEIDVNLSILSSTYDNGEETYIEKLRKMKGDFDRLGRFVASGLRGVARAGGGDEARSWDVLGEMLESGFEAGSLRY
jgi:gamma-tubulin complex component 5